MINRNSEVYKAIRASVFKQKGVVKTIGDKVMFQKVYFFENLRDMKHQ